MLKIDRQNKHFDALATPSLAQAALLERADLQQFIWNSPDAFFGEIGQDLFLVATEVRPSDDVDDRIGRANGPRPAGAGARTTC